MPPLQRVVSFNGDGLGHLPTAWVARPMHSQEMDAPARNKNPGKQPVKIEILWEGSASYGNYMIFATDEMSRHVQD